MGNPCCSLNTSLGISDWVQIGGIAVNAILAIWIICTIQNKLTNKRVLKDHFITEIKDIRNEYRTFLNNLYLNQTSVKLVLPWFKLMSIKINDLVLLMDIKYKIDKKKLNPYQYELIKLITETEEFKTQFKNGKEIIFSEQSKALFIKFQQDNGHLFNDIIVIINDCKR